MFGKKIEVVIEGMKCEHCANSVINSLKSINGIKNVKINLDEKKAIITYSGAINKEEITKAITALNYQVIDFIDR